MAICYVYWTTERLGVYLCTMYQRNIGKQETPCCHSVASENSWAYTMQCSQLEAKLYYNFLLLLSLYKNLLGGRKCKAIPNIVLKISLLLTFIRFLGISLVTASI